MGIEKVVICGLGAVGLTYANKLKGVCDLYILADKKRVEKYKKTPPVLNGKKIDLNYVTPDFSQKADLIIIATKSAGLSSALDYMKNCVGENTIIISLINGISSENIVSERYGKDKVLHSYFIGHSAVRVNNTVTQDGYGKIVFGTPYSENLVKVELLKDFLEKSGVDYEIPKDIIYSLWLKFTMNIFSNQSSAILNLTFGDMKKGKYFKEFAGKIAEEVQLIAEKEGVECFENLKKDSLSALNIMIDSGKTSMLQDIEAGRKSEVDIFSGEIIKLGSKYGVKTPYNQVLYDMIKILEEKQNL